MYAGRQSLEHIAWIQKCVHRKDKRHGHNKQTDAGKRSLCPYEIYKITEITILMEPKKQKKNKTTKCCCSERKKKNLFSICSKKCGKINLHRMENGKITSHL